MSVTQHRKTCIMLVSCSVWLVLCSRHIKWAVRPGNKQINVKQRRQSTSLTNKKHSKTWPANLESFFLCLTGAHRKRRETCMCVCVVKKTEEMGLELIILSLSLRCGVSPEDSKPHPSFLKSWNRKGCTVRSRHLLISSPQGQRKHSVRTSGVVW